MNTPTQDMSHDMRFYSFSIKESWLVLAFTLMSSNFKCRTSLLQWWVLGWTQLQARRKAHLTVLLAFMGEPWSRSNTGGWLWHQAARWGSCAVCSLIQVESFDKFQRPGRLEANSIRSWSHLLCLNCCLTYWATCNCVMCTMISMILSSISVKVLSTVGSVVSVSVSVVGQGGSREALEATDSVQTLQD